MTERRKGIIKINPVKFYPVVQFENGLDWQGTKRECIRYDHREILPEQQKQAFEQINENVTWESAYVKGLDYEYARLIKQ